MFMYGGVCCVVYYVSMLYVYLVCVCCKRVLRCMCVCVLYVFYCRCTVCMPVLCNLVFLIFLVVYCMCALFNLINVSV